MALGKVFYWAPRVLGIVLIFFIGLFSLDVFEEDVSIPDIAIAFIMHNIPTMLLVIVLLVAWKHESIGGMIYILLGLLYSLWVIMGIPERNLNWILIVAGPVYLTGGLFIANGLRKRKK